MRDLIVSVAIVAVLVVSWLFFDSYSDKTVSSVSATIRNEIIPAVEAEHWDLSRLMSGELWDRWQDYKDVALYS